LSWFNGLNGLPLLPGAIALLWMTIAVIDRKNVIVHRVRHQWSGHKVTAHSSPTWSAPAGIAAAAKANAAISPDV
jgi:hypothetical protein